MKGIRALAVLTPYESRRLIAKAVKKLPAVTQALTNGYLVIATGSTTAYVAEEVLGAPIVKENFISGHITGGETWGTPQNPDYIFPLVFYKGERKLIKIEEALAEFTVDDVLIKGANAVDHKLRTAVCMGNKFGGTIGAVLGTIYSRGAKLIIPVGLEKMIPSVPEAVQHGGILSFSKVTGTPVGFMPLGQGQVITEIQALEVLFNVAAYHVASGGIAGSEGAVVIVIEGTEKQVAQAFALIEKVKGEVPLQQPNGVACH